MPGVPELLPNPRAHAAPTGKLSDHDAKNLIPPLIWLGVLGVLGGYSLAHAPR
jgi:hypothetical protein